VDVLNIGTTLEALSALGGASKANTAVGAGRHYCILVRYATFPAHSHRTHRRYGLAILVVNQPAVEEVDSSTAAESHFIFNQSTMVTLYPGAE
jgi:hypothetical protein